MPATTPTSVRPTTIPRKPVPSFCHCLCYLLFQMLNILWASAGYFWDTSDFKSCYPALIVLTVLYVGPAVLLYFKPHLSDLVDHSHTASAVVSLVGGLFSMVMANRGERYKSLSFEQEAALNITSNYPLFTSNTVTVGDCFTTSLCWKTNIVFIVHAVLAILFWAGNFFYLQTKKESCEARAKQHAETADRAIDMQRLLSGSTSS